MLVLGLVVVAAYRDGTGFDVLRRYLSYGRVEQAGGGTVFDYDAAADNRFAVLGERLVVLSATALRILDAESGEVWSIRCIWMLPRWRWAVAGPWPTTWGDTACI